MVDESKGHCWQ